MSEPTDREIEWSGADVKDGTLIAPLAGEDDPDWAASCQSILDVHNGETHGGGWRNVTLATDAFVVQDIEPGAEVALRRHLDDVVQRANRDAVQRKQRNAEEKAREEAEESASRESSERMAETFRGFGQK